MKRFLLVAILAAVLGMFVWALTKPASDQALASPLVGRAAPVFDIPLYAADSTLSLAALRGRPVVLNFWASWCLACRDEAAVLEAGWKEYGPDVAFTQADLARATARAALAEARLEAVADRPAGQLSRGETQRLTTPNAAYMSHAEAQGRRSAWPSIKSRIQE